jgi:TonB family protein
VAPVERMPITETPTKVNEPGDPAGTGPDSQGSGQSPLPEEESTSAPRTRSRWVDYDTHELLEMISDLEDERRWARLREGIWIAILIHLVLLSAVTWIPKYILKVPPVIDPFDAIKQRKDLSYLDLPPDLLKKLQPKVQIKPVPEKRPQIDKKTLEAMNKPTAPPIPEPTTPPKIENPAQPQATPPTPKAESPVEAPHPAAVPARPNFAMGSQNPADQLKEAMRGAAHNSGSDSGAQPTGGLSRHPGAGSGGVQVLSDTQGVDFNPWLHRWYYETEHTWDPLIPDEVNPPILKSGAVQIRFKVLPNGQVTDMVLEGRSGDTGLDRAAWGALTGSNYPPLPREFHGPYLELRALFLYNEQPPK